MKRIVILVFFIISSLGFSQQVLNDYKYVIVPKKFDVFKSQNKHQTSTLIKFLFNKNGFTVLYDDNLPEDLQKNRCLGLLADLIDDSGMFTTKTTVTLSNCEGEEVYRTSQGTSKEKEFKTAYNDAITEAMQSFKNLNYSYSKKDLKVNNEVIKVSFKDDVKNLDKPQENSISNNEEIIDVKKPKEEMKLITQEASETNQLYDDKTPVSSNISKSEKEVPAFKQLKIKKPKIDDIWYAQAVDNGFQLVDSTPKVKMKLLKSSNDNVFIAQTDSKNGMVYQKDDKWVFEYYEDGKLVQEELNLKF